MATALGITHSSDTARETERELSKFSQTLQTITTMPSSANNPCLAAEEPLDLENNGQAEAEARMAQYWVLNPPKPPGPWRDLVNSIRKTCFSTVNKFQSLKNQPFSATISLLETIFPVFLWCRNYTVMKFKSDLLAGLTLASLCIPQSIGYATLAKLDPQYGLYTSVVPPLIYALMGTSRELAIGPVAVISLLLSSMIQKLEDPEANPVVYSRLALTVTFFAGIFQAAFGLLRLGFLVDFLSHAVIVGFMAGAAIVIGLQQFKGLLGLTHFTNKTDIISVSKVIWRSVHHPWNPFNFIICCSFLTFILITRFLGKRNKKLFWLPAIAPLISVVLSTLIVYLTRADKNGVKILKHIKGGLNQISIHDLYFDSPQASEVAKIGLIVAVVALTEAIAVGQSFATMKGYHLDGNKEMLSMGVMNIVGSLTSCYVATGSFSRTAVNFGAGCETAMSNIVMAITVMLSLELFTRLLYYTPVAILASIILSALPALIDLNEAYNIWKVDKLDFLACIGAFFGVLFASVEIGLLVAVIISFAKIILNAIQPGIEALGRFPGTDVFCDVHQYPMAIKAPGILTIRIKSSLLCFANANFVKERILNRVGEKEDEETKGDAGGRTKLVILDMSNLMNIDTSGIASLEELQKKLMLHGTELAMANPRWQVVHKLRLANFVNKNGGRIFLTVGEAMDGCL
ncbi:Sulfate transporter 2.1 like [Actinidia chinensis var. chinensis]|uniref:Sulfate transporter 2.1 like n=1 Tax=Actinidia chinensis var. chinensis TaxID=1590841 RepID=A0A2R6R6A0_ACTCC|nr:Sulfate transporter 2.1 like [Actinidia chinensis var. chinensis]